MAGDRDQALGLEKGLGIAHNAFGWCQVAATGTGALRGWAGRNAIGAWHVAAAGDVRSPEAVASRALGTWAVLIGGTAVVSHPT